MIYLKCPYYLQRKLKPPKNNGKTANKHEERDPRAALFVLHKPLSVSAICALSIPAAVELLAGIRVIRATVKIRVVILHSYHGAGQVPSAL